MSKIDFFSITIKQYPYMASEEEKCYICFEEQSEENKFADPNPCNCRGTIKIHNTCFDTLTKEYDTCGICKTKYIEN